MTSAPHGDPSRRSDDEFERANSEWRSEPSGAEHAARGMGFGADHDEDPDQDPTRFDPGGMTRHGHAFRGGYQAGRSYERPHRTDRPGWQGYQGIAPPPQNHAGKGPRGYQRDDHAIWEEVCERLAAHPDLDVHEVEVTVTGGEVVLSGAVESRSAKRGTERVAESVAGVRDVHNRLTVQGASAAAVSAPPSVIEGYTAGATDGTRRTHGQADGD